MTECDLSKLISIEGGSQPPKNEHIYEEKTGYVRFIQNRDYSSDSHKTYIRVSNKNKLCTKTDIMVDKYGEAGTIRYGLAGAYNVALAKVRPCSEYMLEYLRDFLSQKSISDMLYQSSQASTRPSLNENSFVGIKVKVPSSQNLRTYNEQMTKILSYELLIKQKIAQLNNIKKLLLSKYFG